MIANNESILPRFRASMAVINASQLFVFGGWNEDHLNDGFIVDVNEPMTIKRAFNDASFSNASSSNQSIDGRPGLIYALVLDGNDNVRQVSYPYGGTRLALNENFGHFKN